MAKVPNLFSRLHKWAIRQDENFLTESLAVLLEHLLSNAPKSAMRIIARLTGGFIELSADDAGAISIETQIEAKQGRPDLAISAPHRLVWIEVKVESELRSGQLEGYRVLLSRCGVANTRLGLLTRYPQALALDDERPDWQMRWFEVADWLEDELPNIETDSPVAHFIAIQFLEFLRERNMTLTQVGKYMPEGLRALSSLLNMLSEAAAACKVPAPKIYAGWDFTGLKLDGGKYWIGFLYSEPEKLWFRTRCRINPEAATRLGVGEVTEENWVDGRYSWFRGMELDSEEVHFFSRSKVSQMQWLEEFLRESLSFARSIEAPNQISVKEELDEE